MLQVLFHAWERRLAAATTDRVVRPFDWGLEWIPSNGQMPGDPPETVLRQWVSHVMADTDAFFTPPVTNAYSLSAASPDGDRLLTFPSALETPHPENNIVYARLFPTSTDRKRDSLAAQARGAAVLVLPQWN